MGIMIFLMVEINEHLDFTVAGTFGGIVGVGMCDTKH